MNEDVFKGQWKQIRGEAREWWSKLTDEDLDKINGRFDQMIGKLQEKYGYSKPEAELQIKRFLDEIMKDRIKA